MPDATESRLIRIPRLFWADHKGRDLPTPHAVRMTARHVWIATDDQDLPELLSDARYYGAPHGVNRSFRGVQASARATVAAIEKNHHHRPQEKSLTSA